MDQLPQNSNDSIICREIIRDTWEAFVNRGEVRQGVIREEILQSWIRCKECGLDPFLSRASSQINDAIEEKEKAELLKRRSFLISMARPFLEGLSNLIRALGFIVYLMDENGYILDILGEGEIWEYTRAQNVVVGTRFDEKSFGPTAPCLAMKMDMPYQMVAEEHYLQGIHLASCAAAPIHDEYGNIIGCLDITSSYAAALKHPHTLGLVATAAKLIENQIRLVKELNHSYVAGKYLSAAMEATPIGLIILDRENQISHINKASEQMLGVNFLNYNGIKIDSLVRNSNIISALNRNIQLAEQEVMLNNSSRCLLSLGSIFDSKLEKMGSLIVLKELKDTRKTASRNTSLNALYNFESIWGKSPQIRETIALARRVAKTSSNIIILGESGTGKEMLAQSIHNASSYSDGPFLGINCTAIPSNLIESELFGYEAGSFTGALRNGKSGQFERAQGGTLLLDEISGMPLDMQAKLLRVLEEKRYQRLGGAQYIPLNVRIIAATNKDLAAEVENGNFRNDLYFRLSIIEIHLPPLRERLGDIGQLARKFIEEISTRQEKNVKGISPKAIAYLEGRSWPGNVRQLKNWVERAVILAESNILQIKDFPQDNSSRLALKKPVISSSNFYPDRHNGLAAAEREAIRRAIEESNGNIVETARKLGISRATLYRKVNRHDLTLVKKVF